MGVHVNTAYAGRWGVFPNWYLLGCELLSTCYPTYVHVHVMDKVWTTGVNQCARVCACLNSTAGGMCMCQSHSWVSELPSQVLIFVSHVFLSIENLPKCLIKLN